MIKPPSACSRLWTRTRYRPKRRRRRSIDVHCYCIYVYSTVTWPGDHYNEPLVMQQYHCPRYAVLNEVLCATLWSLRCVPCKATTWYSIHWPLSLTVMAVTRSSNVFSLSGRQRWTIGSQAYWMSELAAHIYISSHRQCNGHFIAKFHFVWGSYSARRPCSWIK